MCASLLLQVIVLVCDVNTVDLSESCNKFVVLITAETAPVSSTIVGAVIGIVSTISIIIIGLVLFFIIRYYRSTEQLTCQCFISFISINYDSYFTAVDVHH